MASENLAVNETGDLIAASKVNGTKVYNGRGDSIGSIYDVMIDKHSGAVAYAVVSFGGFFGIGENYSPLPWSALRYDTGVMGYVVDDVEETLKGGPHYTDDDYERWEDRE